MEFRERNLPKLHGFKVQNTGLWEHLSFSGPKIHIIFIKVSKNNQIYKNIFINDIYNFCNTMPFGLWYIVEMWINWLFLFLYTSLFDP